MAVKDYIKSFFSFSLGTWFRALLSFFTTPVITYLIIPEEFGRASMFTLALNIALIISLFGTDQSFVRFFYEYPEEHRKNLLWTCLSPSLSIASLFSFVFFVFEKRLSEFLFNKQYPYIGLLFSIALFISVLQRFNQLTVRMQKKGLNFSLIDITNSIVNVSITILYAFLISKNFYAIIFGNIFGSFSALILGLFFEKSYWKLTHIKLNEVKKIVKYGLPFVPNFLIMWLFQSIDRISIKQYSTFTELGLYSAAFKIVSVMNLIQAGFTQFWVPVAYERYENNNSDKKFFKKANISITFIMFVFGFLVLGFKDIIFMILAKSYRESAYIAPFLILSPIMYTISETTVMGINFTKKTYWHFVISVLSAIANFIGNTAFVPIYGAKGAAISTGLSYILFFTLRTVISEKLFKFGFEKQRVSIEIILITIIAFLEMINRNIILNILYGLIGVSFTLLLYRKELILLKNELIKKKN